MDERQHPAAASGPPFCSSCRYSLRGLPIDANCPECGTPVLYSVSGDSRSNGFAVASLVLGICAIVLGCGTYGLIGLVCGPLAIVYHAKAKAKVVAGDAPPSSMGLARAGMICGWIGLALAVPFVLLLGLMIVGAVAPVLIP